MKIDFYHYLQQKGLEHTKNTLSKTTQNTNSAILFKENGTHNNKWKK